MKRGSNQIKKVVIYRANFELEEPFRTSLAEISAANNIVIRIHLENGLYGTGEARPNPVVTGETQSSAFAAGKDKLHMLTGKSAYDIEGRMNDLDKVLTKNSALKSAVDIALYDLLGKISDMPLYQVLGGEKRPIWTDNTVSLYSAEEMAQKALIYMEQGFRALKVKLGDSPERDIERIKEIRRAIGHEIPIRIDANQGWSFKDALKVLKTIEGMNIEYCEQPLVHWDLENMRELRYRVAIPIMADETLFSPQDAFRLATMKCCDYFNIKLTKSGGIHKALMINAIGQGAGIPCMAGCMTESRLALGATAHLVSARPNIRFCDLDGHISMKTDPVIGGVKYAGGDMELPDAPGHGADFEPDFLESCEFAIIE
jgi:L-alanine-DL-glutamate epimerase-like enolase superfamily enzyme